MGLVSHQHKILAVNISVNQDYVHILRCCTYQTDLSTTHVYHVYISMTELSYQDVEESN